jgi:hypothetical protein
MANNVDFEFIYLSMIKEVFVEFCDLVMIYVPSDKVEKIQELGRTKARAQKKRAKDGLKDLPVEQQEVFVLGCYEELKVQLLRVLRRMLGESEDYVDSEKSLEQVLTEQKKQFKKWMKERK